MRSKADRSMKHVPFGRVVPLYSLGRESIVVALHGWSHNDTPGGGASRNAVDD